MDILNGETGMRFAIAVIAVGMALGVLALVLRFLRNRPIAPLLARPMKERQKRLTVIDAVVVDTRRRVVLIRRDDVEHLILIGGPSDLVIESGIVPSGTATTSASPQGQAFGEVAASSPHRVPPATPRAASQSPPPFPSPTEETNFTYGPDAVLSARDFAPEPPKRPAVQNTPSATRTSALDETDAETIIQMLRARVLGGQDASPELPQQQSSPLKNEAADGPRNGSAFARMLDGMPEEQAAAEQPRPATPQRPAWAPAMDRLNPTTPKHEPVTPQTRESLRREQILELEMARILEEMRMRQMK